MHNGVLVDSTTYAKDVLLTLAKKCWHKKIWIADRYGPINIKKIFFKSTEQSWVQLIGVELHNSLSFSSGPL